MGQVLSLCESLNADDFVPGRASYVKGEDVLLDLELVDGQRLHCFHVKRLSQESVLNARFDVQKEELYRAPSPRSKTSGSKGDKGGLVNGDGFGGFRAHVPSRVIKDAYRLVPKSSWIIRVGTKIKYQTYILQLSSNLRDRTYDKVGQDLLDYRVALDFAEQFNDMYHNAEIDGNILQVLSANPDSARSDFYGATQWNSTLMETGNFDYNGFQGGTPKVVLTPMNSVKIMDHAPNFRTFLQSGDVGLLIGPFPDDDSAALAFGDNGRVFNSLNFEKLLSEHRYCEIAQAFFHYVFQKSGGRNLMIDMQGVVTDRVLYLVDPLMMKVSEGMLLRSRQALEVDELTPLFEAVHPRCVPFCKTFDPSRRAGKQKKVNVCGMACNLD